MGKKENIRRDNIIAPSDQVGQWVSIRKETFDDVLDNLYSATMTLECLKASIQASIDKVDKSLGILDPEPDDEAELDEAPEQEPVLKDGVPARDPGETVFSDGGIPLFLHMYERPKKRKKDKKRKRRKN